ncbi:MAG TPA: hypothetical protein VHP58_07165 [Alphaproteobacteria bacterium]|nr:hypothetical protein [Alphaproteobacteria bacterium]
MSAFERQFEKELSEHNTVRVSPDWLLPLARLVEKNKGWGGELERADSLFDQCMVLVKTNALKDGKPAPQWKVYRLHCTVAPSLKGDIPGVAWERESFDHAYALDIYKRNLVLSREQLLAS